MDEKYDLTVISQNIDNLDIHYKNIVKIHWKLDELKCINNYKHKMENYKKVIELFDKAYELGMDFSMYANFKSLSLYYLWGYEKALELINKWIEEKPDLVGLYNTKALILYKIGECKKALKTIKSSFKFMKENEFLYTNARLLLEDCFLNNKTKQWNTW